MSIEINETKIKKMAQKYRKYKIKNQSKVQQAKFWHSLSNFVLRLQLCWMKIIPYNIRGYKTEFELFNYYWKKQMGKDCSNELISTKQIEQTLQDYKIGDAIVLGLTYESESIQKIISFINSVNDEEYKNNVIICPINLQGAKYKEEIEHKITLLNEEIIILWRGLFNQIIILNRFRLGQMKSLKNIRIQIQNRIQYQGKIKQFSQKSRDGDSKSQILI